MKIFISLFIISIALTVCSCNNNAPTPATVSTDTTQAVSKYTLQMVDSTKDPACGMPLSAGIADTLHYGGKVYGFCSDECRDNFLKDPKKYLSK